MQQGELLRNGKLFYTHILSIYSFKHYDFVGNIDW